MEKQPIYIAVDIPSGKSAGHWIISGMSEKGLIAACTTPGPNEMNFGEIHEDLANDLLRVVQRKLNGDIR